MSLRNASAVSSSPGMHVSTEVLLSDGVEVAASKVLIVFFFELNPSSSRTVPLISCFASSGRVPLKTKLLAHGDHSGSESVP